MTRLRPHGARVALLLAVEAAGAALSIAEGALVTAYALRVAAAHLRAFLRRRLVVIALTLLAFMVVAAIAVPVFAGLRDPPEQFARLDLLAIAQAIDLYRQEQGTDPQSLEQLVPRYLKELHRDPWGGQYRFARTICASNGQCKPL